MEENVNVKANKEKKNVGKIIGLTVLAVFCAVLTVLIINL